MCVYHILAHHSNWFVTSCHLSFDERIQQVNHIRCEWLHILWPALVVKLSHFKTASSAL